MDADTLRDTTLKFIEAHRRPGGKPWEYRYSQTAGKATLYSSAYAAMTRSLYNDLNELSDETRRGWIEYFDAYQDDDGLYRDPVIFDQGWYAGDPLWCGRPHLTCHVLTALACLGGVAKRPFEWVRTYYEPEKWLSTLDMDERVAFAGNEIMNVGTILQYARDFHRDDRAGRAVEILLDWLDVNGINPSSGIWGTLDISDPVNRSQAVQAAYHWWPLYFYDQRPVPYVDRAIDTVLATQNPNGGFGCGVHNTEEPFKSSACEDVDSIDPLARMTRKTEYRRDDIRNALESGLAWVMRNQMPDGGFVFMLDRPFEYGHPELASEANMGAMFPTWFRTLTVALLGKALPESWVGKYPWHFVRCPGYQFW